MKKLAIIFGSILIGLFLTSCILKVIGDMMFQQGLDEMQLAKAKSSLAEMDKTALSESIELYAADKSVFPIIKIKDVTGTAGTIDATRVMTASPALALDTAVFTPDTTQVQFDGTWYNVTAVTATSVTLATNAPISTSNKEFTVRYCNPLDYESTPATALTASYTNGSKVVKLTTPGATWSQAVVPGTQIKIAGVWYDIASRTSDTEIYLSANFKGTKGSGSISLRQIGYVDSGTYVYPLRYISVDLMNKIKTDIPGLLDKGNGIFQVVDIKAMADDNYIKKVSDKGFAAYNATTGVFDATLLNPAINPDKYNEIYIRHSTTGLIYYVEGVKSEDGTIKY